MSTDTISPLAAGENAEVLRIAAHLGTISAEKEPKHWQEGKRDLALAVARHRLLLVVDQIDPPAAHLVTAPGGGLLIAFTDAEAAEAWSRRRHPADPAPARFTPFPQREPSSRRGAGGEWRQLMARAGADTIIVNPAGPLSFVIREPELATRPRLRRQAVPDDAEAWTDLAARAAARARDAELGEAFEAALQNGDDEQLDALRPAIARMNEIDDILLSADIQMRTGRWCLAHDEPDRGAQALAFGAIRYGSCGDLPRCIDALLLGADLLTPALDDEADLSPEQAARVRHHAHRIGATLQRLAGGYRAEEVEAARARLPASDPAP